jgi:hypothetical protein
LLVTPPHVREAIEPPTYTVEEAHAAAHPAPPPEVGVRVAVAPPPPLVAVAVGVRVGVAPPAVQVPLFVHQLSVAGLYGELGGQSRFAAIGAIAVYLAPLNVTDVPFA